MLGGLARAIHGARRPRGIRRLGEAYGEAAERLCVDKAVARGPPSYALPILYVQGVRGPHEHNGYA